MAHEVNFCGAPLIQDPAFRQRVAQLQVDMKALEITQYRVVSAYDKAKGAGKPDPLSSVLKVKGTELLQATIRTRGRCRRTDGHADLGAGTGGDERTRRHCWRPAARRPASYLMLRAASIYGGTNEIQKNILTKAVLGL